MEFNFLWQLKLLLKLSLRSLTHQIFINQGLFQKLGIRQWEQNLNPCPRGTSLPGGEDRPYKQPTLNPCVFRCHQSPAICCSLVCLTPASVSCQVDFPIPGLYAPALLSVTKHSTLVLLHFWIKTSSSPLGFNQVQPFISRCFHNGLTVKKMQLLWSFHNGLTFNKCNFYVLFLQNLREKMVVEAIWLCCPICFFLL